LLGLLILTINSAVNSNLSLGKGTVNILEPETKYLVTHFSVYILMKV